VGLRKGDRVNRPTTRFLCRWVPRRSVPRHWNAKGAARVVCHALSHGHSRREIDDEIQKRCQGAKPQACDCNSVELLLRQVLVMAAAVAILLAISRVGALALPVILATIVLRLLPNAVRVALIGVRGQVRQLPDASKVIEGTFFRVREELSKIEAARRSGSTISSSGVRG